jgi:hypothetical protein
MNALPSPKPDRRKRLALRFAVLAAAASVLGAAHWFTRPPELVWCRRLPIRAANRTARVLVPQGWAIHLPLDTGYQSRDGWTQTYYISPVDSRPGILRWILRFRFETAAVVISVQSRRRRSLHDDVGKATSRINQAGQPYKAARLVVRPDESVSAHIAYYRTNLSAFKRTYRQICDSLTIE